ERLTWREPWSATRPEPSSGPPHLPVFEVACVERILPFFQATGQELARFGPTSMREPLSRLGQDERGTSQTSIRQGRAVGAPARPASGPVPGSPQQTVYGLGAQLWAHMSPLVRCPKLLVLRTGCPRVFVHTFCLTAQGLDGDPVYLLDELLCYRFK